MVTPQANLRNAIKELPRLKKLFEVGIRIFDEYEYDEYDDVVRAVVEECKLQLKLVGSFLKGITK